MSEIDYEELIRSPMDDLDVEQSGSWGAVAAGTLAGVAVAVLLSLGFSDSTASEVAATSSTTTTGIALAEPVTAEYPEGYIEFAPGIAAHSGEIIIDDELVVVAFTTAAIRGSDPVETKWPRSGTWVLESESGVSVESSRMVTGGFSPGAFSVHFPAGQFNGASDFAAATLIERWDQQEFIGSVTLPFTGEPFVAPEPITIPISQEVTLLIPQLELGSFIGSVHWVATGAENGANVTASVTLLDADGAVVGTYDGFASIIDPADSGRSQLFWQEPFPTDQEGAVTAVVDYTVSIPEVVPTMVEFDLAGVPLGR